MLKDSDPQSDAINSTLSFSARSVASMVNLYLSGFRNLTDTDLERIYTTKTPENSENKSDAYEETSSMRSSAGMRSISEDQVSLQMDGASKEFFLNYVTSAGLELEYANDISETENLDRFPGESDRTSFITSLAVAGVKTAPPQILNSLKNDSVLSEQVYITPKTKHLVEPLPYQVADDNQKVSQNLKNLQNYVRTVFRGDTGAL